MRSSHSARSKVLVLIAAAISPDSNSPTLFLYSAKPAHQGARDHESVQRTIAVEQQDSPGGLIVDDYTVGRQEAREGE